MEEIRQEFANLNRSFWQRGDEKSLLAAKEWDKVNPKRKKSQVKEWNELAMRYSVRTLRLIKIIENCKPEERKELAKIIKEEIHEKDLLEIFRIAWKNLPDLEKKSERRTDEKGETQSLFGEESEVRL